MRPPGGLTTDMFNFANEIDVYREWANIVVSNRFEAKYAWAFHCAYVGRKFNKSYARSSDQVLAEFGEFIVHHQPISGVFAPALGDYGYLIRSPKLDEIIRIAQAIQEKV
jgi:hypothetical protein